MVPIAVMRAQLPCPQQPAQAILTVDHSNCSDLSDCRDRIDETAFSIGTSFLISAAKNAGQRPALIVRPVSGSWRFHI